MARVEKPCPDASLTISPPCIVQSRTTGEREGFPTDFVHGLRARIFTDQDNRMSQGKKAALSSPFYFLIRFHPCPQAVYEVRGPFLVLCCCITASRLGYAGGLCRARQYP